MKPEYIPDDINAEVLLNYYPQDSFFVRFKGLHKRNSYRDLLDIEEYQGKILLSLGRNSIYNLLPEYLFHSIDRFDGILQEKDKFAEECAKQKEERENAFRYFAPIDTMLLQLRLQVREKLDKYVEGNKVMQDILLDNLGGEQRNNRFVKRTSPYITSCKTIKGNRTLLTLLLRKVFMDEGITIRTHNKVVSFEDERPRYNESEGSDLESLYVGNSYEEPTMTFTVHYWSDDDCGDTFLGFIDEIEVYRQFVQDYFMPVDSLLVFDITEDAPALRLSDTTRYNYLNYNTNI